jgi:1-phosphofructokinase family hexose kinase
MGGDAACTGFLGGLSGQFFKEELRREGIQDLFLSCSGETRTKIAIEDIASGVETEINEPGPHITKEEQTDFLADIERIFDEQPVRCVALCGSLPQGVPDDFYTGISSIANKRGILNITDTSGSALTSFVKNGYGIVKPNREEAASIYGRVLQNMDNMKEASHAILQYGISAVLITLGGAGAVLFTGDAAWRSCPPAVHKNHTLGSGDAFLAGYLLAMDEKKDMPDALRFATAVGTANAMAGGPANLRRADIDEIAALTDVQEIR